MNVNPAVLVRIESPKGVSEALELDAELDEVVEENYSPTCMQESETIKHQNTDESEIQEVNPPKTVAPPNTALTAK